MLKLGKEPRFKFFISINDYEQDALDGPDYRKYPFNIYPKNSSLQFAPDDSGCCKNIVDHWHPIIERIVGSLKKSYPTITMKFIRNSSLKTGKHFKKLLIDTLKNPKGHAEIFSKYSGKEVLDTPIQYAGIVCPKCKKSHGVTTYISAKKIKWECANCLNKTEKPYEYYNYWWYHKAMLTARLRTFGIQVAMSGADHFNEGDYNVRRHFFKKYFKDYPEPDMIFCPVLIARDGQKMSKSRNNEEFAKITELIAAAEGSEEGSIAFLDRMVEDVHDGKSYSLLF
jgi:lysyl-tRNA synthetase class I